MGKSGSIMPKGLLALGPADVAEDAPCPSQQTFHARSLSEHLQGGLGGQVVGLCCTRVLINVCVLDRI